MIPPFDQQGHWGFRGVLAMVREFGNMLSKDSKSGRNDSKAETPLYHQWEKKLSVYVRSRLAQGTNT